MKVSKKEQKARRLKAHRKAQQDYITLKENKLYCYSNRENSHVDLIYTLLLSRLLINLEESKLFDWEQKQGLCNQPYFTEDEESYNLIYKGKYLGQTTQILKLLGLIPLDTYYLSHQLFYNSAQLLKVALPLPSGYSSFRMALGKNKTIPTKEEQIQRQEDYLKTLNEQINNFVQDEQLHSLLSDYEIENIGGDKEDKEENKEAEQKELQSKKENDKDKDHLNFIANKIYFVYEHIEQINTFYIDSILSDLKVMPSLVKKEIGRIVEETHSKYKYEMKHTIGSKFNDWTLNEAVREELNNNQYFLMLEEVYRFIARLNISVSHINLEQIQYELTQIVQDTELSEIEKQKLLLSYRDIITILNKNETEGSFITQELIINRNSSTDEDLDIFPLNKYTVQPIWKNGELFGKMDYLNKQNIQSTGRFLESNSIKNFSEPIISKVYHIKMKTKEKKYSAKIIATDKHLGKVIQNIYQETVKEVNKQYPYLIQSGRYYNYIQSKVRGALNSDKKLLNDIKQTFNIPEDAKIYSIYLENQYDISVLTQEDIDNNKNLFISDTKELDRLTMEYINYNLERHYNRADRNFIDTSINKLNELMNYVSTENLDSKDTEDIDKKLLVNQTSGWFSSPCLPPELIINLYEQQLTYLNFNEVLKDLKPTKKTTEIKLKRTRMLKAQKEKYIYAQKQIWDNGKKFTEGNGLIKWYREIKLWELSLNPLDREVQLNKKYTKERCERILGHLKKICESICITSFQ